MEPFHSIDRVYYTRDSQCRLVNPISLIGRDNWLYISELLSLPNYAIFNIEYGGVKSMSHRMGELEPFHARDKAHVSLSCISRRAWYFRLGGRVT